MASFTRACNVLGGDGDGDGCGSGSGSGSGVSGVSANSGNYGINSDMVAVSMHMHTPLHMYYLWVHHQGRKQPPRNDQHASCPCKDVWG
jgi:hypothetical protein